MSSLGELTGGAGLTGGEEAFVSSTLSCRKGEIGKILTLVNGGGEFRGPFNTFFCSLHY